MLSLKAVPILLSTALGFLGCVFPAGGQSTSNQDEVQVRQLYQQITYLTQVTAVSDSAVAHHGGMEQVTAQTLEAKVTSQQATFVLGSFQQGAIADIHNKLWTDLVTPDFKLPLNLVLTTGKQGYTAFGGDSGVEWFLTHASWRTPNFSNLDDAGQLFSVTVGTMMDQASKLFITPDVIYTRYVAYTITASFNGQTVGPYKAMALFGKNGKGESEMSVQDNGVFGATTLASVIPHAQVYPLGLVQTQLREVPAVTAWLTEHSVSASSCSKKDASQLCCSEDACGVADTQLHKDLSAPLVAVPAAY